MKIKLKNLLRMNWTSTYISEDRANISYWSFKHSSKEITHTGPSTGHLKQVTKGTGLWMDPEAGQTIMFRFVGKRWERKSNGSYREQGKPK